MAPKEQYPPELQKRYDAYWKAFHEQVGLGKPGMTQSFEDFAPLTPEQRQQYRAWERAKEVWLTTGGNGPFPQPTDFMKDDPPPAQDAARP